MRVRVVMEAEAAEAAAAAEAAEAAVAEAAVLLILESYHLPYIGKAQRGHDNSGMNYKDIFKKGDLE